MNTMTRKSLTKNMHTLFFGLLLLLLLPAYAIAACSSYSGKATINEVYQNGKTGYVEIRILDSSITTSTWSSWSVTLCPSKGSCGTFSLSSATNNYPWLVIEGSAVANYIDLKNGMDILLKDASGNTIDYLSINGVTRQQDSSCSLTYPSTFTGGTASTKTIARQPDGTGSWAQPGPGNSVKPTKGASNNPNVGTLDHIELDHPTDGITCEPSSITLRACTDSTCSSLYTGAVSVTLSPSGWVGGNTQTISGGSSSFQFRHTTAGTVTLGVSNSSPLATNGTACVNTAGGTNNCQVTFHDSGFIYTIPRQTSCMASNAITVSAVRLDNTSQQCVPTFVSQTRNLNFSLAYSNPTTGTRPLILNYAGTNYSVTTTGVSVPVNFNASGQASINLTYQDAGQVTLNSQYTGSAATGDAGLIMNGSTTYVTAPARLYVYSNDANSACSPASPTCSAFVHAGAPFNLKIRAACADNTVTPNFQLSGLTLSQTNVAPAISKGSLGVSSFDITAADQGEHVINNETVSEVGAFTFTASAPSTGYFGQAIGTATLNTSTIIGRFTPDHFCVTANSLTNRTDPATASACTDSFTYLGEEFTANTTVTAQATGTACLASGITQNYSGTWSQFTSPLVENTSVANEKGKWNYAAVNSPTASPADLSSRLVIDTSNSTGSFSNGKAVLSTRLKITRLGSAPGYTAEAPLTNVHIGINPLDNDGIGLSSHNLAIGSQNYFDVGSTGLYFGRLVADNAYGSNDPATPLDMFAYTEYCASVSGSSCTNWQAKTNDSCTLYNINPPAGTALGLNAANDGLGGYYQRASATVSSSTFDFGDTGTAPSYARMHVPDTSGHSAGWRLFYTAGGSGGNYTIPFYFPFSSNPAEHPYLIHQNGIASFGQFRGDDRIIYWREILK